MTNNNIGMSYVHNVSNKIELNNNSLNSDTNMLNSQIMIHNEYSQDHDKRFLLKENISQSYGKGILMNKNNNSYHLNDVSKIKNPKKSKIHFQDNAIQLVKGNQNDYDDLDISPKQNGILRMNALKLKNHNRNDSDNKNIPLTRRKFKTLKLKVQNTKANFVNEEITRNTNLSEIEGKVNFNF